MLEVAALIKQLREEAGDVKGCFTTYSMQALVFSSLVLTAIFGTMEKFPLIVLSGIPVIILLMIICRVGIYKYSTANRLYGYELHLARSRHFDELKDKQGNIIWKDEYRRVPWEEAQRAWRVVQTCLFRKIYETPETNSISRIFHSTCIFRWVNYFWPFAYKLKKKLKKEIEKINQQEQGTHNNKYAWFLLKEITSVPLSIFDDSTNITHEQNDIKKTGEKVVSIYHAGTYLKNILSMILIMQYILLLPLVIAIFMPPRGVTGPAFLTSKEITVLTSVLVVMLVLIALRYFRVSRRRTILEEELLSIHSCAIVWQVVIMAHFRALGREPCLFHNYTRELTKAALEFSKDVLDRTMFMGTLAERPECDLQTRPAE